MCVVCCLNSVGRVDASPAVSAVTSTDASVVRGEHTESSGVIDSPVTSLISSALEEHSQAAHVPPSVPRSKGGKNKHKRR